MHRRLTTALPLLGVILVLGTSAYRLLEGWSWLDSLYMTVTSITTMGVGEVHPLTDAARVFTMAERSRPTRALIPC